MSKKEINYKDSQLVVLTKVRHQDDVYNPDRLHDPGFRKEGLFIGPPMVGERFWVGSSFSTSEVVELLPNRRFATETCIWEYEVTSVPISEGRKYGNSRNRS